ncbi:transcription factor LBX1 [Bos indicus x Bos taurus]|uniref:Transcription factor LBX1 n=2 Tax=Bos TaxID=9903 RepID=E1BC20_BOVIN|nr:transcription factor LBX1 [Bos taurus]XP_027384961.1 transcription factor LBX1 [Bos indicus x Bos taurus]XP_027384963.1 transcription factor LBX1 [Bos indicus x Bos taurus]XP_027384964.1 transcription factor LBX1 [Bos indicus x Bos taurus]XP_059737891.1 transcription factor LBX1 isoform X1 [Bos taurus]XP_059737892.1 transcription factor LBX1 isoform X1 [Bos taurus]DAA14895.1 TPA: ladybird homeobox homolog 1-like [Bos taurus]
MTSKEDSKAAPGEERRRSPLDHLPPPANSNKPLTPFSIEDILNKPSVRRSYSLCGAAHLLAAADKHAPGGLPLAGRALLSQTSPLCALEELASKTFKGLEVSVLQAAEGRDGMTIFGQRQTPKKRRKSRTAFTNHQIYELEKRFLYQKYLSPADRDQIAQQLGLTNAQVITWFQNRRAKLKRDLEEMKADVESAKKLGPSGQMDIVALAELEQNSEAAGGGGGGGGGRAKSRPGSPALTTGAPQAPGAGPLQLSPASPLTDQPASSQDCSEDEEDEEIDVDD